MLIQTPEYGGGEIWFDDVLIRKDGLFVLPELRITSYNVCYTKLLRLTQVFQRAVLAMHLLIGLFGLHRMVVV